MAPTFAEAPPAAPWAGFAVAADGSRGLPRAAESCRGVLMVVSSRGRWRCSSFTLRTAASWGNGRAVIWSALVPRAAALPWAAAALTRAASRKRVEGACRVAASRLEPWAMALFLFYAAHSGVLGKH